MTLHLTIHLPALRIRLRRGRTLAELLAPYHR